MAKKKKKEAKEQKIKKTNNEKWISPIDEDLLSEKEMESLKNYNIITLNWKTQIIIAVCLFAFFSILFLTYLKLTADYSNKKVDKAEQYIELIQKYYNDTDSDVLKLFAESPEYTDFDKFQQLISKNIGNFFYFLQSNKIEKKYLPDFKKINILIPSVTKILKKKKTDFHKFKIIKSINSTIKLLNDLKIKSKDFYEFNENNIKNKLVSKNSNHFHKRLIDIKNLCFEVEDSFLKLRGLWNKQAAYDAAIELLDKSIYIDDKNIAAYYNLAKIYEELKDYELAGERYVKVIQIEPDSELANKIFNKFLNEFKKNPDNQQSIYNLAMAYYRKNNKIKAKEFFEKIIKKDPNLKTFLGFMAKKRINEMNQKSPEVIFDPRI